LSFASLSGFLVGFSSTKEMLNLNLKMVSYDYEIYNVKKQQPNNKPKIWGFSAFDPPLVHSPKASNQERPQPNHPWVEE
jgi:hypothetical protein